MDIIRKHAVHAEEQHKEKQKKKKENADKELQRETEKPTTEGEDVECGKLIWISVSTVERKDIGRMNALTTEW